MQVGWGEVGWDEMQQLKTDSIQYILTWTVDQTIWGTNRNVTLHQLFLFPFDSQINPKPR